MFIKQIFDNLRTKGNNYAICLDDEYTTYAQLSGKVNGIRSVLREKIPSEEKGVGLIVYSLPDTYAAIIALWLEGKYYVPMLPFAPTERNKSVTKESSITHILSRKEFDQDLGINQINIDEVNSVEDFVGFEAEGTKNHDIAYLLFTSGSTGTPKGVPITFENIDSFINSMWTLGHVIYETDRCLQMFDLTFDFSVTSYLLPLYAGACIYLIPDGEIKASYVLDLLEEYHLTVLNLVPSVMTYLKRFFNELCIEETRLCSFCGEALLDGITKEWQKCLPNCRIINFYGPTEDTVFCTYYDFNSNSVKTHNGVVSIGKNMPNNNSIILNEKNEIANINEEGELCLSGPQLTPGYWNKENNIDVFFEFEGCRYYRTGDLCYRDKDGDYMYIGRKDFQAKIQGFRVELSEIEHYATEANPTKPQCVCVAFNSNNLTQIGLAVCCNEKGNGEHYINYIKEKLPPYEVPSKVLFFDSFPMNTNGKIDRKKIIKQFEKE